MVELALREKTETLPLSRAVEMLLDECRMVLPGIQALFGFQLIAVFSQRFDAVLSAGEQLVHLVAIALGALAIVLVMTPAALHRRSPTEVTATFVRVSTRLLLASMVPLALSLILDFYLVALIIAGEPAVAALTAGLVLFFAAFWLVLPRAKGLQQTLASLGDRRWNDKPGRLKPTHG